MSDLLSRARVLALLTIIAAAAPVCYAQVSPIGSLGSIQLLDNNGVPATSGCFYFFVAGTSTQAATFTDSSGTVQNTNPLCVGAGARAVAWLSTGAFYKIVACLNNDGNSCSGGDILWSQDQVPGGATSSGGGGGPPFTTSSANPATTGVLRCASGDSCLAFRNTANSSNLILSKDVNDILSWSGGSIKFPEVGAPTSVTGADILYADNTAHRLRQCNNGAACDTIVGLTSTDTLSNKTLTNPTINTGTLNNTGGTLLSPTIAGGIVHGGTGFQHTRFSTCTTAAALNATCSTTFTWPGTWADTNYSVVCFVESGNVYLEGTLGATKSTTQFQITIINDVGSNIASSATVDCIGVHD